MNVTREDTVEMRGDCAGRFMAVSSFNVLESQTISDTCFSTGNNILFVRMYNV